MSAAILAARLRFASGRASGILNQFAFYATDPNLQRRIERIMIPTRITKAHIDEAIGASSMTGYRREGGPEATAW